MSLRHLDIPDDLEHFTVINTDPGRRIEIPDDLPPANQGTEQWHLDKCGCISASRMADVLAEGKGINREKYLYELVGERITGKPTVGFSNYKMDNGTAVEPKAREDYEFINGVTIVQCGFVRHPTIPNYGSSPDGCLDHDGLIEMKRRDLHIHLPFGLSPAPPRTAYLQMQAQLSCTGRKYVKYVSYNETLPPEFRLFEVHVDRDEETISIIESAVKALDAEINSVIERLNQL